MALTAAHARALAALLWWVFTSYWGHLSPTETVAVGVGAGFLTWLLILATVALGPTSSALALRLLATFLPVPLLSGLVNKARNRLPLDRLPLPPGPPGELLLGHYRIVPFEAPFKKYAEWSRQYNSDVLFFSAPGQNWIVLNSLKAATDLLDKRGAKYSDRPPFVLWQLMGWAPTLTWMRWGPKMRLHRRVLQRPFVQDKVNNYYPTQRREALRAVASMAENPKGWMDAVRLFAAGVVLDVVYGIQLSGVDDPLVRIAEEAAKAVGNAGAPASSIVDRWPITRHLPSWLPFMERLRYAEKWKGAIGAMTNVPFEMALEEHRLCQADRHRKKCFVVQQLEEYQERSPSGKVEDETQFTLEDIKGAAATITIAGSDTTASTIKLFVLYMMQNPRVQARARAELDLHLGTTTASGDVPSRLPNMSDIPSLTYLKLVLQECYRSNPLSPLGIPHATLADDDYNGMHIPKDTVVYQNVWAMTHDLNVYSDPDEFLPERYLPTTDDAKDGGSEFAGMGMGTGRGEPYPVGNFGFGRRICVGRHLAENSLFIMFATLLATFEISPPVGDDGVAKAQEVKFSYQGQANPQPFEVSLKPRSERALELLREAAAASAVAAPDACSGS